MLFMRVERCQKPPTNPKASKKNGFEESGLEAIEDA
jgi:hypothetical protein